MNYDELVVFIDTSIQESRYVDDVVDLFDEAISSGNANEVGECLHKFCKYSVTYEHDAIFARELIEYIDGLNESQDNGGQNDD